MALRARPTGGGRRRTRHANHATDRCEGTFRAAPAPSRWDDPVTPLRRSFGAAAPRWDSNQRTVTAVAVASILAAAILGAESVTHGPKMILAAVVAAAVAVVSYRHIEVMYVGLYAAAFIGPAYLGNGIWPPVITLIVIYIAVRELIRGRDPVLSSFLFLYCAIYIVALIHGTWNPASVSAIRGLVTPALLAMATASVARDARTRRRLILLMVPFVALQLPTALLQSLRGIGSYGASGFDRFGDSVTGTLGSSASGTLTLVTVGLATVLFAAALERVWKPRILGVGALLLASGGILSVARAVFIFVPVAATTTLLASAFLRKRSIGMKRIATVATLIAVATPATVIGMSALYPGVTKDINSIQKIRDYLFLPQSGSNPERAGQLEAAVASVNKDFQTAFLGQGLGSTDLSADPHVISDGTTPVAIKQEQFANSVWTPRVLVEAGVVGVLAFLALLAYAVSLAIKGSKRSAPRSWDSAIALSLPGLAALTLIGSFYQTVLDLPPYATIFWVVLGLGMALSRAPRRSQEAV
jgi:hypothetical protein